MKQIYSTLIFLFMASWLMAQNVNLQVEIITQQRTNYGDCFGCFDPDPTWNISGSHNGSGGGTTGICWYYEEMAGTTWDLTTTTCGGQPCTADVIDVNGSTATSFSLAFDGWEEDGCDGDCVYGTGLFCNDDTRRCNSPNPLVANVQFREDAPCTWHSDWSPWCGDFRFQYRYYWEFDDPPGIATQPLANNVACSNTGVPIELTAAATLDAWGNTTGLHYQWQISENTACPGSNWVDIPGATSPTLSTFAIAGTRLYRVVITSNCSANFSSNTITSNCSVVTYNPMDGSSNAPGGYPYGIGDNPPPIQSGICNSTVLPGTNHALGTLQPPIVDGINNITSYSWSATGGGLSSTTGSSVSWTAPSTSGAYTITVQYLDGCGVPSSSSCLVTVGAPDCDFVYVSPSGSDSPAAGGGPTSPYATLSYALANRGVRNHIKMKNGPYTEGNILELQSDVIIEGGYEETGGIWTKSSTSSTVITCNGTEVFDNNVAHRMGFRSDADNNWKLIDLDIRTNPITNTYTTNHSGYSNYALYIMGSSGYEVIRCNIQSGNASNGDGDNDPASYNPTWDGGSGSQGSVGSTGGAGECTCNIGADDGGSGGNGGGGGGGGANAGNAGGGNAQGGGAGGRGGNGRPDNSSSNGFSGNPGTAPAGSGSTAGGGGSGGTQDGDNSCDTNGAQAGGTSTDGGDNGTPGTNATAGTFAGGYYVPGNGTDGTAGRGGAGGGGGGGAGRDTGGCDAAGGGGSGGSGGGGGGGAGAGAGGGGSSFGIYLYNNTGAGIIVNSSISSGTPGAGGDGGDGGNGGPARGAGALGNCCGDGDSNRGNRGGGSSAGGVGGAGGNGAPGTNDAIRYNGGILPTIPAGITVNSTNAGGLIPAAPVVTIEYNNARICKNSVLPITTTMANWGLPAGMEYVDLDGDGTPDYTDASLSAEIYSTITSGDLDLMAGGQTFHSYLQIAAIDRPLSTLTITNSSICANQFVDLEATDWTGGTELEYSWEVFQGDLGSLGSMVYSYTTADPTNTGPYSTPGTYTVVYQVREECCGWSIPVFKTFVVNPDIANNFITPTVTEVCDNAVTALIDGSVPTGGDGSYTYAWEVSTDGVTFTPIAGATGEDYDPLPTYSTPGTYYFQRIVTSGGCENTSNTVTIEVLQHSDPPTEITYAYVDPVDGCNGGTVELTIVGGMLGTNATWTLYLGDPATTGVIVRDNINSNTTTILVPETGTYYIQAEDGCNVTTPVSVEVVIPVSSTDPTSLTSDPVYLCGTGSVDLTLAGGTLGSGASWYLFDSDPTAGGAMPPYAGSAIQSSMDAAPTFTVSGVSSTTTFYVLAEGTCNTTAAASVEVVVNTPPVMPTLMTANPSAFCGATPVTFDIPPTGWDLGTDGQFVLYNGTPGDPGVIGFNVAGFPYSFPFSVNTTTTFQLYIESALCGNVGPVTATITIDMDSPTAADPNIVVCGGTPSSYDVTQHNAEVNATGTVLWYDGDPNSGGTFISSPTMVDLTTVDLWALVTDGGACVASVGATVSLVASPTVAITGSTETCNDGTSTVTLTADAGFSTYVWSPSGSGQSISALAGTYTVTATDASGCTASATHTVTGVPCMLSITDPCVCLDNATTGSDGQFGEVLGIMGPDGDTWTITNVTGLSYVNNADVTETATVGTVYPTNLVTGATFTESSGSPGDFALAGVHIDNVGYTIEVTSTLTGKVLSLSPTPCQYIDALDLDFTYADDCDENITVLYMPGVTGTPTYTLLEIDGSPVAPVSNTTGAFILDGVSTATFNVEADNQYCISQRIVIDFTTDCGGFLPVELLDFYGYAKEKVNTLHWITATEENTKYHIIERSNNGTSDFREIGRVDAAGNSVEEVQYELDDQNPLQLGYYRIRTVDLDGAESLSNIISISRDDKGLGIMNVYPVPTKGSATIEFISAFNTSVDIRIVDVAGRLIATDIYEVSEGLNLYQLDLSKYASGIYFVSMNDGNSEFTTRLVKE